MSQEPTKAPHRYQRWDEYTIAEVGRRFTSGTREDRLELLSECYAEGRSLPYEIASQVLDDPDPTIRLWMAKHARNLDLRERIWTPRPEHKPSAPTAVNPFTGQPFTGSESDNEDAEEANEKRKPEDEYKHPDRNLWGRLEQDADPLVRAALYENPEAHRYAALNDLPQIKRLAYMRNPEHARCGAIASDQILAVFDPSDKTLEITESQREELALAYLANPAVIAFSQDHSCHENDECGPNKCPTNRRRLWSLLAAFPSAAVGERGFRFLGSEDKLKAEVYRHTEDRWLRMELLLGARETDVELLKLGAADKEECCREVAGNKFVDPNDARAKELGILPDTPWGKYVWTGLTSAVPPAIGWLAFGLVHTPFERLILALLGLLYLGMIAVNIGREVEWEKMWITFDAEFRKLRRLAGEQLSEDEQGNQRWEYAALGIKLKQQGVARWIRATGQSLGWVYVIYQLYMALVEGKLLP
jgi:hypothetical protein